jgi:hypothetical protein
MSQSTAIYFSSAEIPAASDSSNLIAASAGTLTLSMDTATKSAGPRLSGSSLSSANTSKRAPV